MIWYNGYHTKETRCTITVKKIKEIFLPNNGKKIFFWQKIEKVLFTGFWKYFCLIWKLNFQIVEIKFLNLEKKFPNFGNSNFTICIIYSLRRLLTHALCVYLKCQEYNHLSLDEIYFIISPMYSITMVNFIVKRA